MYSHKPINNNVSINMGKNKSNEKQVIMKQNEIHSLIVINDLTEI